MPKYQPPDFFTQRIMNPLIMLVGKTTGMTMKNTHTLSVRGRNSGEMRSVPVSPIEVDGVRYLVAPRGHTQWVRNLRASRSGRLWLGRRAEEFSAEELPDSDKVPLLRAYLKKWSWEVGQFFGGVGADAPEEELRRIAPDHPVFRIS